MDMELVKFIGAKASDYDFKNANGKQVKGTSYTLFIGRAISEDSGVGFTPIKFKIDLDVYKDITSNLDYDSDLQIAYESAYDKYGNQKYILKAYKI